MIQVENVIEKLKMLFSIGDYDNAEKLIESARKVPALYNDVVAIFDANLCLNRGNCTQMWTAIKRGLESNPENYELYVMLGEYYWNENPNQAYLCLENALLYCDNDGDKDQIQGLIEMLKNEKRITIRNVSFIILSYNTLDYTKICIDSIRKNTLDSSREIVIVDNASTDGSVEWLRKQKDIVLRENKENSGFPKGCNQGVEVASEDNDIFLLNNDTYLPPNALFWLRMGLYESEMVGTTGSVTNRAINLQEIPFDDSSDESFLTYARKNNVPWEYPYEEKNYLIGYALLIKRSVFDEVGKLDERYSPGNHEDNDYGIRVLKAGYRNILCRNSFITHYGSKSFEKDVVAYNELLAVTRNKFIEKWGINPQVSFSPNLNLVDVIEEDKETKFEILEIGCGCGATSAALRFAYPYAKTYGVEKNPEMAAVAACMMETICGDIETEELPWKEGMFDYILLGEVFPYLQHPEDVLKKLESYLKQGGQIIISVPNMKHFSIMLPLLMADEFSYSATGLIKPGHIRMYTGAELYHLVESCGFEIVAFISIVSDDISPGIQNMLQSLINLSNTKRQEEFITHNYIVKIKKR